MLPTIKPLCIKPVSAAMTDGSAALDTSSLIETVNGLPMLKPVDPEELASAKDRHFASMIEGKEHFQFSDRRVNASYTSVELDDYLDRKGIKYTKTAWHYDVNGLAKTRMLYDFG